MRVHLSTVAFFAVFTGQALAASIGGEGNTVDTSQASPLSPKVSESAASRTPMPWERPSEPSIAVAPVSAPAEEHVIEASSLPVRAPALAISEEKKQTVYGMFTLPDAPLTNGSKYSLEIVAEFRKLVQAGVTAFEAKKYEEALAAYDKADKLVPGQISLQNYRGMAFMQAGRTEEAGAAFARAVQLGPRDGAALFMQANYFVINKEYGKARENLVELLKSSPHDESLRFNLIVCLLKEKSVDAARAETDKLSFTGDTAAYYFAHSALAYAEGQIDESAKWIQSGVSIFGKERVQVFYDSLAWAGLLKVLTSPLTPPIGLSTGAGAWRAIKPPQ